MEYDRNRNLHKTVQQQIDESKINSNGKHIDLSYMGLTEVDMSMIPPTCVTLCIQGNCLTSFPAPLPPHLKLLFIEQNNITSIPEGVLPPTLDYLCAPYNEIASLPTTWPPALQSLYLAFNKLPVLPPLPTSIQNVSVMGNPLLIPQTDRDLSGQPLADYLGRLKAEQDRVEEEASRRRCEERFRLYADELLALALHPDRIDRWAQEGAFHSVF